MKRYGHLWEGLVSWDNLLRAARKARRGKRDRGAVQAFEFDLEHELLTLQQELETGAYRPGDFRSHWIYRPKKRLISAAPYRDRVVHHALCWVVEVTASIMSWIGHLKHGDTWGLRGRLLDAAAFCHGEDWCGPGEEAPPWLRETT